MPPRATSSRSSPRTRPVSEQPFGGSSGYCVYQSPAPYQSEYTGNFHVAAALDCFCNSGGIGGLLGGPPPPTYDQFTKWGEADADDSLQSSSQAVQAGAEIAAGLDFGAFGRGRGRRRTQ